MNERSKENKDDAILPKFFNFSYRVHMTSFIKKKNTKEGQVEREDEFIVRYTDFEVSMRHLK